MDNESEVIRQQMDETRTSLQDKLETLEQHVTGTVQHVTETVSETVDNVKEAVQETVDSVKNSLDLRQQVERNPWSMFLGAALVGYVGTRLIDRTLSMPVSETRPTPQHNGYAAAETRQPSPPKRTLWNVITEEYHEELGKLKGLAVSAVGGVVREMLTNSAPPPLAEQIKEVVDGVTVKLGGQPVQGPILNLAPNPETAQEPAPVKRHNGIADRPFSLSQPDA